MRNIIDVVDAILLVVPQCESNLIRSLNAMRKQVLYIAPEQLGTYWDMFGLIINIAIPYPPETDWQKRVVNIFEDKESL